MAPEIYVADREWDVILIGAGQNNFALGTYLGKAGLKTVICESRLENGGRLASEEITMPGYWHNTLAYFQDNRESPRSGRNSIGPTAITPNSSRRQ